MKVTINDIAKASGFSKTTVSFAFNDPERLSKATREKIIALAEELGYVPDPVARNLSMRKLGTIGLLLPQSIPSAFENPFIAQILRGMGDLCQREGYSITLVSPMKGCMLRAVRNAAVDGFISLGLDPGGEMVELIRKRSMPIVDIDGSGEYDIPTVITDDCEASDRIMSFVLSMGHRRIGVLSFRDVKKDGNVHSSLTGELRLAGYSDALSRYGLSFTHPDVHDVKCDCSLEGGHRGARRLLGMQRRPTAIVAMSDIIAIGVYRTAEELGLSIPDDLSVAGFDDIPEAALVTPKLTTVYQPGYEKGSRAVRILLDLLAGGSADPRIRLGTHLTVRDSVKELTPV